MKKIIFLLILFVNGIIHCQTFKGVVRYDTGKHIPVEYASINNLNNQNYTFTDSLGKFEIIATINDTIEVKHQNSTSKKFLVKKLKDTIKIFQNVIFLKEVIVSSSIEKARNSSETSLYGFSTLITYAIKINKNSNNIKYFNQIKIPIKFKKKYSNEGKIKIQIVKNLDEEPIFNPLIISLSEIKNKTEIIINLYNEKVLIPESDYYILIERIIENRIFKKNESLSANPFLYYIEDKQQNNLYLKNKFYNKWISMDTDSFGINPKIIIEVIP